MSQIKNITSELILESKVDTEVIINGQKMLYFAGVGYYQLQSHPKIIEAGIIALSEYGITTATSRSINGTNPILKTLEVSLAEYFLCEDAIYLPSGYMSNMAGLLALKDQNKFTHIFIDEDSHYCLKDAAILCQIPVNTFLHCQPDDLERQLQKLNKNHKPIILSDGMFPVYGRIAPVNQYLKLAEKYNGLVWIDDAHSVGINGEYGKGTFEHFRIASDQLHMGATLSKAFGTYGGFVVGSEEFISKVRSTNIPKGTTAPQNAAIGASIEAIRLLKENPQWRKDLWNNALYLKQGLQKIGINMEVNAIPVAAFHLKDASYMKMIQSKLMKKGIYIQFLNYIGSGAEGVLRIVVFSTHTQQQIDCLINELKAVL
ncbi:aminotransferase class I/II-fold pyridoxal phosphate-dependent enzyme [Carboxylicivirga caseinilyticus]|uniref:aminotransferase class I/II-fold pyridoxal phosphate-dependent enzyme n=1 Tax=Carboxylicivirga caseinilyticus TaxID=3417572 RepID=UPI003D338511|nr:pyridoxal phosphate-dependent aminotransferase family protein [Marinilabiliaceae bacterium A049]